MCRLLGNLLLLGGLLLWGSATVSADHPIRRQAAETTATPTSTAAAKVTAISECHLHETVQYCMVGTTEYRVMETMTATTGLPSSYTACHSHGSDTYCISPDGGEVEIVLAAEAGAAKPPAVQTAKPRGSSITAVSECHTHGSSLFCMAGESEYYIMTTVTATSDIPPAYTGCHSHGSDTFCISPTGDDVEIVPAEQAGEEDAGEPEGENCHFHAGVEHCVGGSHESGARSCERKDRNYNVRLRVGMLFVILATSAIGVFGPILLTSIFPRKLAILFSTLKQFGTGVIISTAFVHLLTHANLMFENECLGELKYEGTAASILMAGLFLSFLVDYAGQRLARWHAAKKTTSLDGGSPSQVTTSTELVNVTLLEAGIIFHSLLIGVTLVVAGDSVFVTLTIVIIFHQMFEGIALGTRIAALGQGSNSLAAVAAGASHHGHHHHHHTAAASGPGEPSSPPPEEETKRAGPAVSTARKLLLASAFAVVTPIGMAIGIGVLGRFNGNDPSTIIALGTLDSLSAGILAWVGVVEMLAEDWMPGGELAGAGLLATSLGMTGLVSGMVVMSVLGKWA